MLKCKILMFSLRQVIILTQLIRVDYLFKWVGFSQVQEVLLFYLYMPACTNILSNYTLPEVYGFLSQYVIVLDRFRYAVDNFDRWIPNMTWVRVTYNNFRFWFLPWTQVVKWFSFCRFGFAWPVFTWLTQTGTTSTRRS